MKEDHVTALRTAKPRGRPFSEDSAALMGRKGGLRAAENRETQLATAREVLYAAAPVVAERLANVAVGGDSVSPTDLQAMSSVLDRTVGKVPTEVRIGLADQTMQVLDMLELEG